MSNALLTKKALARSLKQLMEHTPLAKITVRQLVEHCGVNRQTFYYHFQDLFDLLGWIYRTEALEGIAAYRSYETWTDGFQRIFAYIEQNKAFCRNTLDSLGRNHLDAYLYSVTNDLIMGVIGELCACRTVAEEDQAFIANFYTLAFTGLIIQWMRDGMREDPALLIRRLSALIEGHFVQALDKWDRKLS